MSKKYVRFLYLFIDIFLISLSFYIPYALRYNKSLFLKEIPHYQEYILLFFLWAILIIYFFHTNNLYSTDRSLTIFKEVFKVSKCIFFSSVISGLLIFFLQIKIFSRFIFVLALILLIFNLSLFRILKRLYVRYRILRGYSNINVLIIGATKAGVNLAEQIKLNPYLGLKIVGFLDDQKSLDYFGYRILGKIKDLKKILEEYFIDEVYIAGSLERKLVLDIINITTEKKKGLKILIDNFGLSFINAKVSYIGFVPILEYFDIGLHGTDKFIKRFLDVFVSSIILFILLPLFIVIAILIKIDSKGPVFYISKRCGRKKRLFNLYKFRSMIADADKYRKELLKYSDSKDIFKMKKDPRVTKLGRFLRRYSLDELPQLINVLRGDMSLVGPRPFLLEEVEKLDTWQLKSLNIKPGITGLWQIRGRSDVSLYRRVKWDIYYINNWSLSLDIKILFLTIPVVLKRKGAY